LADSPYKAFEQLRKRLQKIGVEEEEGEGRLPARSQGRAG